jgi:protoheme IX farnesyltransferase
MTRLYRLSLVTAFATYALIVLGGITRVSGSGLGCADDWPKCHGRWYPPLDLQSIIEYLHRTVAASIGALVLATAIGTILVGGTRTRTRVVACAALFAVVFQALLGAITVWFELPPEVVTAHLGTAMIFFALTLLTVCSVALDRGAPRWLVEAGRDPDAKPDQRFARVAQAAAAVVFLLILTGAATSTTGAALACTSWPLCQGNELIPARTSTYTWIHLGHRTAALIAAITIAGIAWEAFHRPVSRAARRLAVVGVAVIGVQILLGASYVLTKGSPWLSAAHLATATLLWVVMFGIALVAGRPGATHPAQGPIQQIAREAARSEPSMRPGQPATVQMSSAPAVGGAGGLDGFAGTGSTSGSGHALALSQSPIPAFRVPDLQRVRTAFSDYLELTKPGILILLLVTTFGAMLIAAAGIPPLGLILATLAGGALAAGGANVLNCYLDRDIDALMTRTRGRATVRGHITPTATLIYGLTLSAVAVVELGLLVNWLAATLALAGNLYYVFVYTKWLKRLTPQNIVVGGAAGAVPPLVGWAAATGTLAPMAWALFAVVFFWTPPHFWALALLKQGDYGRAAVPMLPVVAGEAETRLQILLYSVLLVAVSLLLVPLGLGPVFLIGALALNAVFLGLAVQLFRDPSKKLARHLFFFSIWYLALLFVIAVADRLLLA